jgi:phospholipase/carboxylesterase
MDYLPTLEIEAPKGVPVNAAVIWLHGLGADGSDFAPVVSQLDLAAEYGIRFVFPHAPSIPVTINNGYVMPAWYDIKLLDLDRSIDAEQLLDSARKTQDLINREIERGIDPGRIVLAGFSQGGAVVYEAALTFAKPLAGLITLSTYLPTADTLALDERHKALDVLVCHGSHDPVVPEALGRKALADLQKWGLQPEYKTYPMEHSVCLEEITDIAAFLRKVLS